jgi:hypothetical protein
MLQRNLLSVLAVTGLAFVSTQAFANARFGAKLSLTDTQPANEGDGTCQLTGNPDCTWILNKARNCEFGSCLNGHKAPITGTIGVIRVQACTLGSFVLQIARVSGLQAKVVHTGPLINYENDPQNCEGDSVKIQPFGVTVPVTAGDYLAVMSQKITFQYCSGGGGNTLLYARPIADGPKFRTANSSIGCFLLLEAIYK